MRYPCTLNCEIVTWLTGLNVFQRLALVSQFLTVFGGLMFVIQEAIALNNAISEDLNGKFVISMIIIIANAAAGGLYPIYRFVTAVAENGEIDMDFLRDAAFGCVDRFFGIKLAKYLYGSCGCLVKAKETLDHVKEEAEELFPNETVHAIEARYLDAKDAIEQIEEARNLQQDMKEGTNDLEMATKDVAAEAGLAGDSVSSGGHDETEHEGRWAQSLPEEPGPGGKTMISGGMVLMMTAPLMMRCNTSTSSTATALAPKPNVDEASKPAKRSAKTLAPMGTGPIIWDEMGPTLGQHSTQQPSATPPSATQRSQSSFPRNSDSTDLLLAAPWIQKITQPTDLHTP